MDFAKCEQCGSYLGLMPVEYWGWAIQCAACDAWVGDRYDTLNDAVEAYVVMRDANS